MNLVTRIAEANGRLRPRSSPRAAVLPSDLPLDSIIEDDCIAAMKRLPDGCIDMLFAEGNPAGVKAVLKSQGVCSDYVRLPLVAASEDLQAQIATINLD